MDLSARAPQPNAEPQEQRRLTSFEELVAATAPHLHRTAVLLCGDHHAAEDLVQSTYAKLFASWRRVRRSRYPLAYCRTTLTRTWVSERRLRRASERPSDEIVARAASEADVEGDPDGRLDVLSALSRLEDRDRAVLVLRFYEDLSVTQTADLLGIGEAAVRKRSQRALQRLRTHLPDLDAQETAR